MPTGHLFHEYNVVDMRSTHAVSILDDSRSSYRTLNTAFDLQNLAYLFLLLNILDDKIPVKLSNSL